MSTSGPAVTVVGQLGDVPPVRFAQNGDVHLAYQQFGSGTIDLVGIPPIAQNIEVAWEHPRFRQLFAGLASFSRYLHFDKRGTGMSDRDAGIPSLDQRVDDLRSILDHAMIERAVLSGVSEGAPIAMLFAATYPERVQALVLYGTMSVLPSGDDAIGAQSGELVEAWLDAWGTDHTLSPYAFSPSLAGDPDYLRWSARYERQSASPGDIRRLYAMAAQVDVREFLPLVRVPTLVLHRREDPVANVSNARLLAEQIPGSQLLILEGADHAPHSGDLDQLVEAIRTFVHGPAAESTIKTDRALATVLFTDLVGSTALAARLGDARWSRILDAHDDHGQTLVAANGGRFVKSTGDGLLAVFDGPARAIHCADALGKSIASLGLEQRAGLHAGEIERRGDDVAGLAVNIAARVQALARTGEILVTSAVRDLVVGSDIGFASRGIHALRGVPDEWELLAATA